MPVTDFLKQKWETIFIANDLTKDGAITIDDARSNIFAERFARHHNIDKTKAELLRTSFQKSYRSLFLCDRFDSLRPQEYVIEMEREFLDDKNRFYTRMRKCLHEIVEIFDFDGDGTISEGEFVVILKCWGVAYFDKAFIQKFPQSPPGFIPNSVYLEAWVQFWCNDDKDNIREEKPVLESLGLM